MFYFSLFVEEINKTNFQGVSGHIHFNGGDRPGNISIVQKFLNETRLVGRYEPGKANSPGSLDIYHREFRWLTQGGIRPTDGNTGKGSNSCLIKKFCSLQLCKFNRSKHAHNKTESQLCQSKKIS